MTSSELAWPASHTVTSNDNSLLILDGKKSIYIALFY